MPLLIEWIRKICGSPKAYMDIGAGDGYDCGVVADAFPGCVCYAFEPIEAVIEHPRIKHRKLAIGASQGDVTFHVKQVPGIHSIYDRGSVYGNRTATAHMQTLEEFCRHAGIKQIDAAKIDVEGAAWDVLIGAGKLLDGISVLHIETETVELFRGQHLEPEVYDILEASGMEMVHRDHVADLGQGDSIWVRAER